MRKRKKLGLFCFWRSLALGLTLGLTLGVCMGLVVGGGQAWANPIPCEYLTLSRQAGLVEVRFEANKACYETAPDLTQSTTYRDFFPVELSFTLQETAEYFTFSATDFEASAERHLYTISLSSYDISKRVEPSGEGRGCVSLEGSRDGEGAVLVLSLDTECLTDPLAELEYRLWKEPQGLLDSSWAEGEGGGYIEATATDDVAGARYVHYDLGVRAGEETFYASLDLDPNSPDAAVGDAGVGGDAGDEDPGDGGDKGGGCHVASGGGGAWLFFLALLVFGLLVFKRRG